MIYLPIPYIKEITLLSIEEASKLPQYILAANNVWWLRSRGRDHFRQVTIAAVDSSGFVVKGGVTFDNNFIGVRPAIRISNLEFKNLEVGEVAECFEREWYYVGDDLFLMKDVIGELQFDSKSNDFDKSLIKDYLNNWLLTAKRVLTKKFVGYFLDHKYLPTKMIESDSKDDIIYGVQKNIEQYEKVLVYNADNNKTIELSYEDLV